MISNLAGFFDHRQHRIGLFHAISPCDHSVAADQRASMFLECHGRRMAELFGAKLPLDNGEAAVSVKDGHGLGLAIDGAVHGELRGGDVIERAWSLKRYLNDLPFEFV